MDSVVGTKDLIFRQVSECNIENQKLLRESKIHSINDKITKYTKLKQCEDFIIDWNIQY